MSLQMFLRDHGVVLWSPIKYPTVYQDSQNKWIVSPESFELLHADKSLHYFPRKDGVKSFLTDCGIIFCSQNLKPERYPHHSTFECGKYRFFYPEALNDIHASGVYAPPQVFCGYPGVDFPDHNAVSDFLGMLEQKLKQEQDRERRRRERHDQFIEASLNGEEPTPERLKLISRAWSFDLYYDFADSTNVSRNGKEAELKLRAEMTALGLSVEPLNERFAKRFDKDQ